MQARPSRPFALPTLSVERHDFENQMANLSTSLVLTTSEDNFKLDFPKSFTVGFHPFVGITVTLGAARVRLDLERELFVFLCRGILETSDSQAIPEQLSKAILIHNLEPALNQFGITSQCPVSIEAVQFAIEKQGSTNLWVKPRDSVEPILLTHTPSGLRYWARMVFPHGHLTVVNRLLGMLPRETPPLPSRIPFTMHLFLGWTRLSHSCFVDLELMDVVVMMHPCHPHQTKAFGHIEGWGWAIGSLDDARFILEEKMSPQSHPWQESNPNELETLPVQLTFEVGQCTVTLGELAQLNQGSILTTQRATYLPVHILANGCSFARGELVEVGSEVGVRIRTLLMGAQERLKLPKQAKKPRSGSKETTKNPRSQPPETKRALQRKLGNRASPKAAMPPLPTLPQSATQPAADPPAPAVATPASPRPSRLNRSLPSRSPRRDQQGANYQKSAPPSSPGSPRSEPRNPVGEVSFSGSGIGYKG